MKRWGVALAVLVALFAAGPGLRWIADRAGATASAGWTALHFAEPEIAAQGLEAGETTTVTFVIENHEGSLHTYSWEARLITGDSAVQIEAGQVELSGGSSIEVSTSIIASQAVAGSKLEIALHNGLRIDVRVAI